MTLKIRPVRLKQSIYFRVPIDIADLIGLDPNAEVTLNLEERDDQFLLIYSVGKGPTARPRPPYRHGQPLNPSRNTEQLAPVQTTQRSSILDEEIGR